MTNSTTHVCQSSRPGFWATLGSTGVLVRGRVDGVVLEAGPRSNRIQRTNGSEALEMITSRQTQPLLLRRPAGGAATMLAAAAAVLILIAASASLAGPHSAPAPAAGGLADLPVTTSVQAAASSLDGWVIPARFSVADESADYLLTARDLIAAQAITDPIARAQAILDLEATR